MANKTVTFNSYLHNGAAGLTALLLDPEDGSIGNGAGDSVTPGSNGQFSFVVTEAITGWWKVVVLNGSVPILEGGAVYFASDTLGTYPVDDPRLTPPWYSSAAGTGSRLVSITVLLDAIAQQGARVRVSKGAETYIEDTDADGLAEFSLNDGTWRVSITLANTRFTPVDLVVNANKEQSYSLTALPALEASDPDMITGYWLCLSQAGAPESGVTVTLTTMSLPANSTGLILDSASRSVTTGADGIASFTNLIPGVRYKVKRNSGREFYFVCPDYQSDPVDLASFIGT